METKLFLDLTQSNAERVINENISTIKNRIYQKLTNEMLLTNFKNVSKQLHLMHSCFKVWHLLAPCKIRKYSNNKKLLKKFSC